LEKICAFAALRGKISGGSRKGAKAQKKIGAGARLLDGWAWEFGCGNLRVGGVVWCA
jgi:hypothetical protein